MESQKIKAAGAGTEATFECTTQANASSNGAQAQRTLIPDLAYLGEIAKACGYGPMKFIARLKNDRILMANRMPYQAYLDRGYFRVVERRPWQDSLGNPHPCFTTLVTPRGQAWLMERYAKKGSV